MANKKMTKKYWDSLSEDSRYRALRKVLSNFPDTVNRDYAKQKAKDLDWLWEIIVRHVRIPEDNSWYKTVIDKTYLP